MFALTNRRNGWGPEAGAASAEFTIPRTAVIASHHTELADAGLVLVTVLPSVEHPARRVLVVSVGRRTEEPLVRIQSSCLYGETLGSLDCDCGDQMRHALRRMRDAGSGVLVYLDQEGRGAGLTWKAVAYELAERLGFDTFAAYDRLGFQHDLRSYGDAVRVLQLLRVDRCRLLTNNPAKIQAVADAGIAVQDERIWVGGAHLVRARDIKRRNGYLG